MKNSIYLILLFIGQICFAQDNWINYTNNNKVTNFVETEDGIWLGSEGGLCFYNTNTSKEVYYNTGNSLLPGNRILDVFLSSDDELWAATSKGICKIDNDELIIGPTITGMMAETLDGKIVVGGSDFLHIQNEGMNFDTVSYPLQTVDVNKVEVDQETGEIYVNVINYFSESYLAKWKDGEWTVLHQGYLYETEMLLDKNNTLWFYNPAGLQYYEDGEWNTAIDTFHENSLFRPQLFVNTDNEIIFSLFSNDLTLHIWDGNDMRDLDFVEEGNDWDDHYFAGPSEKVSGLYYGSHFNKGFYSFTQNDLNEYIQLTQSPIYSNFVLNTLHTEDGGHIVIFSDAIQQINSGDWKYIPIPEELNGNIGRGFLDDEENLWIRTFQEIWKHENGQWEMVPLPTGIDEGIYRMDVGKNGDVWIQAKLNLARYRNGEWEVFTTADHGFAFASSFNDIKMDSDNGNLWISTLHEVKEFDGEDWHSYSYEPNEIFFNIEINDEGAYISSGTNIYYMKSGTIDSIPIPDELFYNSFNSEMFYDNEEDVIYLTGNNSLAIYKNEEWIIFDSSNSEIFGSASNDIRLDNDENLWMSGRGEGLCIYNENGITTLSVSEKENGDSTMPVRIFPTLVSDNFFYVESERSGLHQITIVDATGQLIYDREHQLAEGSAKRIRLSVEGSNLMFVTISKDEDVYTEKLVKY